MPPRYLKLGVGNNTDRDTSLFQFQPDDLGEQRQRISSWPGLRRAQSTRERLESPSLQKSVAYNLGGARARKEEESVPRRDFDLAVAQRQIEVPELRRASSTRESTIHQGLGGDHQGVVSSIVKNLKQHQPKIHLPRTQSMRYNRIVSADSSSEEDLAAAAAAAAARENHHPRVLGIAPPRHSCVEKLSLDKVDRSSKRLVRISDSYQTRDGEILSIECAQCGRWLGTVSQRLNLDEGSLKLCQICHPVQESMAAMANPGDNPTKAAAAAVEDHHKKASGGFLRGLRRMLGLKTSKNSKNASAR
ncbi:hypothetical protein SELMODRAFT_447071 [Selaginella moellendorffii]|uniref:Uncharacterized protein n=1 Tax=Selaginella moellendorffii TaxID=88036 RepID=D8SWG1_SELML|nr:uncharacterized protein LOC9663197 [Selaginella moellendorffii]EFJ11219.1 hypothetical protein SELMODRAFT_447071 [Selaginella moellendorffii]|eukprot:XP_002987644.1 uncharacterized protein LOC9663197 [Selaginella moellendorffii]